MSKFWQHPNETKNETRGVLVSGKNVLVNNQRNVKLNRNNVAFYKKDLPSSLSATTTNWESQQHNTLQQQQQHQAFQQLKPVTSNEAESATKVNCSEYDQSLQ